MSEKVEKPAQNKAQLARRYALVPAIKPDDMMKLPDRRQWKIASAQYGPPAANPKAGFD
jgi:hypothetical protein